MTAPLLLEAQPSRVATLDGGFSLDTEDLRLAVGLGAQPRLGLVGAGRLVAQNLADRLINPRELIRENLNQEPLATGLALGIAVGAYVGWEGLNKGRLEGSYSFDAGELRLRLSGWYDLHTGGWAGRARVDLSVLLDGG